MCRLEHSGSSSTPSQWMLESCASDGKGQVVSSGGGSDTDTDNTNADSPPHAEATVEGYLQELVGMPFVDRERF